MNRAEQRQLMLDKSAMVKELVNSGYYQVDIAELLGVSKQYVSNMLHHEKHTARLALNSAVRRGKVIRASLCEDCGKRIKTEGHHPDYSKPFDVEWVCRQCHYKRPH